MKKRLFLISLLLIIALMLTSCSEKDPLLGKWQEPITGITLEFNDDNTLIIERDGTSFSVEYEKREPDIIAITDAGSVNMPVQTMTYRIVEDQLVLIVDQVETVFDRAK
jgi:hypothetical protein